MAHTNQRAQGLLARLKLRHLRIVQALGELQTATKVAALFHISPAAVSKALLEAEAIVGMPLFLRQHEGMQPTEIGLHLIEGARLVLRQMERLAESVEAVQGGSHGHFSLSFRAASAYPLVSSAICAYRETAPEVRISVVEGGLVDMVARVESGELDLLFSYDDTRLDRPHLRRSPVITGQRIIVVANASHPLFQRKRIDARELREQQWCIPAPGSRVRHHLQAAFHALDLPAPDQGVVVSDMGMTLSLLQRSHFVAALPQRTADQFAAGNLARELPFRLSGRLDPVMMVWNDALSPRASAKVFRDFVRSYALSHGYVRN